MIVRIWIRGMAWDSGQGVRHGRERKEGEMGELYESLRRAIGTPRCQ